MFKELRFNRNQSGVTVVLVAVLMVVFLGAAALAVDISHLYLVRNELQNAADAGALAGARFLYREDATAPYGIILDTGDASVKALNAAIANKSENLAVEVDGGDIQVGHWSFGIGTLAKGFYLPTGAPIYDIWNYSTQELDANKNLINAVKVTTRRGGSSPTASQAASYFARIFGYQGFSVSAEGTAYIGYTGTLAPGEADLPIGICRQAITDPTTGKLLCGVGRMINSGANVGHETGGWTNFTQDPCQTANVPSVRPYVRNKCSGSVNISMILFGEGMGTTGGMQETIYDDLIRCWKTQAGLDPNGTAFPDQPWTVTLPVILCPGNNTGNCSTVDGAVEIQIVWITRTGVKNSYDPVPKQMYNMAKNQMWTCTTGFTNQQCWQQFVQEFGLKDVLNNTDATLEDKTIYFLPLCKELEIEGQTGGHNYGILAKIPVLVK
jgi:hypothetical protein